MSNDPRVKKLDALRASITEIARTLGGDSRVSDKEMELLQGAVLTDSNTLPAAKEAIRFLHELYDTKAGASPILSLRNAFAAKAPEGQPATTPTAPAQSAERVPVIDESGRAGTLPAGQVDAWVKANPKRRRR